MTSNPCYEGVHSSRTQEIYTRLTRESLRRRGLHEILLLQNISRFQNLMRKLNCRHYLTSRLYACLWFRSLRTLSSHSHQRANLTLISKCGCDGSNVHSIYKQSVAYDFDEDNLFFSSVVPLQLYTYDGNSEKVVVWQNPKPSSTSRYLSHPMNLSLLPSILISRYCRPLKLKFIKGTTSHIQAATNSVEEEIRLLKPSE
ncbi:hypothetical protein J437_LFUL013021 [Ladona fulva]|uniref:Uncharacterized protein n=1 Tax=Ladona fulva TaxID=123851 RepID=A0A8K0KP99_LADFU|nr:hypothetical protein J437_LFUL013021 [Ladona fulva]